MIIKNKIILPLYLVIIWSICNIAKRFITINYDINVILFTLISLLSASIILMIIGKTNKKMIERSLKEKCTWLYTIFEILFSISTMVLFTYVSATQTSLLEQTSTIFAILISYIFFNQKPKTYEIAGCLLIISGIFYVIGNLDNSVINIITYTTILTSFFITARTLAAEYNPINLQFLDVKTRSKIMGLSLFLTIILLSLIVVLIKLISLHTSPSNKAVIYLFSLLPTLRDFLNHKATIAAIIFGVVLLSLTRSLYLYFYASKTTSTVNLLIISAIAPFLTWFLETIAIKIGIFEDTLTIKDDFIWSSIISIGALIMAIGKTKKIIILENKIKLLKTK